MRVAAAQLQDIQGDTPAALEVIARTMQAADNQGVDIICLPECFLQGYMLGAVLTKVRALALDSAAMHAILARLAPYRVAAVIGMIEEAGGKFFNTAIVISSGKIIGTYRKVHLFEENFSPGTDYPVFNVNGLAFGVNICYDARFPEGALELARRGAQVIFYPLNNRLLAEKAHAYREKHLPNLVQRAKESGCYIVSADVIDQSDGHIGYGCTAIVAPDGAVVERAPELQVHMVSTVIT